MNKTKKFLSLFLVVIFLLAVGYSVIKDNRVKLPGTQKSTNQGLKESTKSKNDDSITTILQKEKKQDGKNNTKENNKTDNKTAGEKEDKGTPLANIKVKEDGSYNTKLEVAKYIQTYRKLPKNYIRKNDAMKKGWDPQSGNLDKVLKWYSIGGDNFSNFEGSLPKINGVKYFECDIDYNGGKRNAKRIVYSNKGDIYYTEDHYNTFEKLK